MKQEEKYHLFNCTTGKCVLFNIKTGRQIPKSGESYLFNVLKIGKEKRDAFVDECQKNPERFEQPLKRAAIHNFASEILLKQNKSNQINELVNVRGTQDMFRQLLSLAPRKEIDLNTVFHCPILPEPPCFGHPDGSLRESKKEPVLHLIIGSINSSSIPGDTNAVIADAIFIIQTSVKDKTPTFAAFASSVLLRVLKLSKHRVDLCFDVYELSAIKDIKRESRGMRILKNIFHLDPVNTSQVTLMNF